MRGILESYDSELNPSEHSPQLSFRVREAEETVQKVEAHCAEMEVRGRRAVSVWGGGGCGSVQFAWSSFRN